jgi:hypothetical protein
MDLRFFSGCCPLISETSGRRIADEHGGFLYYTNLDGAGEEPGSAQRNQQDDQKYVSDEKPSPADDETQNEPRDDACEHRASQLVREFGIFASQDQFSAAPRTCEWAPSGLVNGWIGEGFRLYGAIFTEQARMPARNPGAALRADLGQIQFHYGFTLSIVDPSQRP